MPEFIITQKKSDDNLHYIIKNYEHMSVKEYYEFLYDTIEAYRKKHNLRNVHFTGDFLPVFNKSYTDEYGAKVLFEVAKSRRKSAELN